jgi:serine/threonine-protein kinase RsbW
VAADLDGDSPVIRLAIPAASRYLRLARLTAAGIAADIGFDLEAIEDLRVAVDEACALLLEGCADTGAELELRYRAEGDTLVIEGRSPCRPDSAIEVHPVARELLELTADHYDVGSDGEGRHFRLVKRRRDEQG